MASVASFASPLLPSPTSRPVASLPRRAAADGAGTVRWDGRTGRRRRAAVGHGWAALEDALRRDEQVDHAGTVAGEGRGPAEASAGSESGWAGYAAGGWAVLFAAQSFYYAAGGTAGAETWPGAIAAPVLARDPGWVAIMWGTGAAKLVGGVLALALVRPWGRALPRGLLLAAGWAAGGLLLLYGAANLVQHGLMVGGAVAIPDGLGARSARWHLWLWDPWWMVGGGLFLAATRRFGRRMGGG